MSEQAKVGERGRWLRQTKTGGGHAPLEERGDCVPACIASILAIPLDGIRNTHGENWWDRLQDEVGRYGYCLATIDMKFEPPPGYWIAAVPSLNLPPDPDGREAWHAIVCRGYDLVHDPGLGERYNNVRWTEAWNTGKVAEGWVLAPLDAARPSRERCVEAVMPGVQAWGAESRRDVAAWCVDAVLSVAEFPSSLRARGSQNE